MLVCHCEAVTDRVIRECVREGNTTVEAVGACTRAGTGCGGCHCSIEEIIEEEALAARVAQEVPRPGLRRLPVMPGHASADLSEVA